MEQPWDKATQPLAAKSIPGDDPGPLSAFFGPWRLRKRSFGTDVRPMDSAKSAAGRADASKTALLGCRKMERT